MSWFRAESSLRTHPKFEKLGRKLKICLPHARGLVLGLWAWVCETAPDGDLTAYDADDLAIAANWDGDAAAFVQAMIDVKLLDVLDGRVEVHEWMDRAEGYKRAEAAAKRRIKNKTDTCPLRLESGAELVTDACPTRSDREPQTKRTERTDRTDPRSSSSYARASEAASEESRTPSDFDEVMRMGFAEWRRVAVPAGLPPVKTDPDLSHKERAAVLNATRHLGTVEGCWLYVVEVIACAAEQPWSRGLVAHKGSFPWSFHHAFAVPSRTHKLLNGGFDQREALPEQPRSNAARFRAAAKRAIAKAEEPNARAPPELGEEIDLEPVNGSYQAKESDHE